MSTISTIFGPPIITISNLGVSSFTVQYSSIGASSYFYNVANITSTTRVSTATFSSLTRGSTYVITVAAISSGSTYLSTIISATTLAITTLAGSGTNSTIAGTGTNASFGSPVNLVTFSTNTNSDIYVTDWATGYIRKVTVAGVVTNFAGNSTMGYADGISSVAKFYSPSGLAIFKSTLYITDGNQGYIRQMSMSTNIVSTLAGKGPSGDIDGTGTNAGFAGPLNIVRDSTGNLYVTQYSNGGPLRRITPAGVVSTAVAGSAGNLSRGITIDSANNIYYNIVNASNVLSTLYRYSAGVLSTVILTAPSTIGYVTGLCITNNNSTIFAADVFNHVIWRIIVGTGQATIFAGNYGTSGFSEGSLSTARFNQPQGVALSNDNTILYVSEGANNRIRSIYL